MKKLLILSLLASFPAPARADAGEELEPLRDARTPIKITEIYADPSPLQEHAEFLELFNAGDSPVDLSGWRFTKGIKLIFPPHFVLPPRACAVLCSGPKAFKAACDKKAQAPTPLLVKFTGRLDNAGEMIRLKDGEGRIVTDLHYLLEPPWPQGAKGTGKSLQRIRSEADTDDPSNWIASSPTPGSAFLEGKPPQASNLPELPPWSVYRPPHGTGSKPPLPSGWQRKNRLAPSHPPLSTP